MNSATRATSSGTDALIVSLDIGSSSVRTMLFDGQGRPRVGFVAQDTYQATTTPDNGVEIDAEALARLCVDCLTQLHTQMAAHGLRPAGVGISAFWHSFLGVDVQGRALTPIYHLLDTRSAPQVAQLRKEMDPAQYHARTGALLHTSYWPGKLRWLAETKPELFRGVARWIGFGEYLYWQLLGQPAASSSMMSGSGLWNQRANQYDAETLGHLPVTEAQLPSLDLLDAAPAQLRSEWRTRLPLFDGIPWFPAVGDGACDNVGSDCMTPRQFALMVGTTGAMRAISEEFVAPPEGLWCYRVDRRRLILGGALSDGGDVFAWMRRTLQLPDAGALEQQLAAMQPGSHGLTMLPLFAGERTPHWRADVSASITGIRLHTTPVEILRAALESVALRFRILYEAMRQALPAPDLIVASGGALGHSPAWTQMMADVLGHPVMLASEPEASSRGAALLAAERLGLIPDLSQPPPVAYSDFEPVPDRRPVYDRLLQQQQLLYQRLFEGEPIS